MRTGKATPARLANKLSENVELVVFPNPATKQLWVTGLPENSSWNYQWLDMLGRTLGSGTTIDGASICTAGIPRGVCFLRISFGNKCQTWRVILQE